MLLEIREEITPERMKGLSQSKNSKMDNVEEMDKYPSGPGALPVGCQPRSDVAARNLGDDIAPKERTVDHPYGFRVPVEFGFLWSREKGNRWREIV